MATIEKRNTNEGKTTYRVKVRLRGHPPQHATFHRLTDAKKWAQSTEAAIREGRYLPTIEAKRHTLGELIDRYIRDTLPQKAAINASKNCNAPNSYGGKPHWGIIYCLTLNPLKSLKHAMYYFRHDSIMKQ